MDDLIPGIRKRVSSRRREILSLLEELVSINSYSKNHEGINQAGELVRRKMPENLKHRIIKDRNGVKHHLFSTGTESESLNLALVGHVDTVFPPDTESRRYEVTGDRVFGAGITDMKAGVVVIIHALRILDEMGMLKSIPVRCLINGDEEIGSTHSQPVIKELAKWASYGLVFEGGGRGGEVVYARRGIRRFKLTVTGQAQHAGVWEGPKASAILELSRMVQSLEALNDSEGGISLNVGKISGGKIVNNPENTMTSATVNCHHRRPAGCPIDGTDRLYNMVRDTAAELGQKVEKERRGGTSDANFLVDGGVPTLDGMGPSGALDHSSEECIIRDSLFERIELLACLMAKQFMVEEVPAG
jgi:glutamate carboxypeptidase